LELKAERPKSGLCPSELTTYGDHIRARRLDAGLSQRQAAEAIGVDETSVFNWESKRVQPAVRLIPNIILFLGYCLYAPAPPTPEWLKLIRQGLGFSQERIAKRIDIDEGTWRRREVGQRKPSDKYRRVIIDYLESLNGTTY
jgi:transcriptional regulator with XRE-family HTH domain